MRKLMVGDAVFFICSNPDAGIVKRVAKDGSWADVSWQMNRTSRVSPKYLRLLCPVLNGYLVGARLIEDSDRLKKCIPGVTDDDNS